MFNGFEKLAQMFAPACTRPKVAREDHELVALLATSLQRIKNGLAKTPCGCGNDRVLALLNKIEEISFSVMLDCIYRNDFMKVEELLKRVQAFASKEG